MSAYLQRLYGRVAPAPSLSIGRSPQPSARLSSPLAEVDQRLHGVGFESLLGLPMEGGDAGEASFAEPEPREPTTFDQQPIPQSPNDASPAPNERTIPEQRRFQPQDGAQTETARNTETTDKTKDAGQSAPPELQVDLEAHFPLNFGIEAEDFEPAFPSPGADKATPEPAPDVLPAEPKKPEPAHPLPIETATPRGPDLQPDPVAEADPGDPEAMRLLAEQLAAAMSNPLAQPKPPETAIQPREAAIPADQPAIADASEVEIAPAPKPMPDLAPESSSAAPSVQIDRVVIDVASDSTSETKPGPASAQQAPRTAAAASAIGPLPARRMPAALYGMRRR